MISVKVVSTFDKIKLQSRIAGLADKNMLQLAGILATEVQRETPTVTGILKSSIAPYKTGFCQAEVSTNVVYAPFVEYGTSRMAARGMFRKGIVSFKDKATAFLAQALKNI